LTSSTILATKIILEKLQWNFKKVSFLPIGGVGNKVFDTVAMISRKLKQMET
jgi:hypothetical protein